MVNGISNDGRDYGSRLASNHPLTPLREFPSMLTASSLGLTLLFRSRKTLVDIDYADNSHQSSAIFTWLTDFTGNSCGFSRLVEGREDVLNGEIQGDLGF